MKATQAGIIEVAAQRGRDIAAQSGGIVTLAGQVLARHQGNVRQLFADRRAAPVPTPDGEEIVGLVAQVYGLTAMQAASQLARINFAACGATSVA